MDDTPNHIAEPGLPSSDKNAGPQRSHSRRAFLKGIGAVGVAAPFVAIATRAAAKGPKIPDVLSNTHRKVLDLKNRRDEAFDQSLNAAADDHAVKVPTLPTIGAEMSCQSGIAIFSMG